ncbi:MAG: ABC transporter substrate-binding protein [Inquilinaceae bacterium]
MASPHHFSARAQRLALATATAMLVLTGAATAQDSVAPITIVINQSPWFEGFRNVVEAYEEETGNTVELDVNPFAGSLEKQRAAVRSEESPYDILIMNAGFYPEFYHGGFVKPLQEIDPGFELDDAVYTFDDSVYFDAATGTTNPDTGLLMSVPINPNIPLLFYRADLYAELGLEVPETFDQLLANAKAIHSPPERYGIVQRGARETFAVTYDFFPYLWGFGGDFFEDQKTADYDIVINNERGKTALDYYLQLAEVAGHPQTAGQSQSQVIQNMLTGKAGNIIVVIAAWPQMDDPNKSMVPGAVGFAVPPHAEGYESAPPLGHWLGGIPHNIPEERQQAALAFLDWFQTYDAQKTYAEGGGPPVREDVLRSDMAEQEEFRWMPALADGLASTRSTFTFPESAEVLAITELRLNQAISGELGSAQALNLMAEEIAKVMRDAGYETSLLEPLPEN